MSRMDLIENPEPGWDTKSVERIPRIDDEVLWRWTLVRQSTGECISHENVHLHVAWSRVTSQAYNINSGLGTEDVVHSVVSDDLPEG